MTPDVSPPSRRAGAPLDGRAGLVVAHPGHELRLHHWMECERPLVCVLTLGDGADRASRLPSTSKVLTAVGASQGPVYGRWRDRDLYAAVLGARHDEFRAAVDDIAGALITHGIGRVVADAEEGYNPSHDVCAYLVAAAVRVCARAGWEVQEYAFPLADAPDALHRNGEVPETLCLHLDEEALGRKLAAAHGYPEMSAEVEAALSRWGRGAFAVECLCPPRRSPITSRDVPHYEQYGARQVAAGHYTEVLAYDAHVRPLREALEAHVLRHDAGLLPADRNADR